MSSEIVTNVHFTYKAEPDKNALCQGDILEVTDELSQVLKEVHPYFLNEQYKYFMVLSQCKNGRRFFPCCSVLRTANHEFFAFHAEKISSVR